MNNLSIRLRQLRKAKGVLLRQVAAILEVDTAIVSKIESGQKTATEGQVTRLAGYYGVESNELLKLWLCDIILEAVKGKAIAIEALELAKKQLDQQ